MNLSDYTEVWQTWKLIDGCMESKKESESETPTINKAGESARKDFQTARIARCISIPELASKVKCDPSKLAGFERGEEVLPSEVMNRLHFILKS
jgi:ribosome-binding protein aMBF1 (putative translation factor)